MNVGGMPVETAGASSKFATCKVTKLSAYSIVKETDL